MPPFFIKEEDTAMPMSQAFEERLFPILPSVIKHFGTPFHIFDEQGIIETGESLKLAFKDVEGFQEFYAVKALPTPAILRIMHKLGFGLDCSSPSELMLARQNGFKPQDIMFSSNNTSTELIQLALADGGCILNLDDITMITKVAEFPELICFRYNPGERRQGTRFIGNPVEAKYGVRHDQIIEAYRRAKERGAKRFGLHTMIISNELDHRYMVETVRMLLEVIETASVALGIKFEFFNIGGGIGIPYKPEGKPFDIPALAGEAKALLDGFGQNHGYAPRLFMECGRFITGPHGTLVATVINRMSKYREYVGVDAATMTANPRPAIYETAYHHITILDSNGQPKHGGEEVVDVVGPLCENSDKFAKQRLLPRTEAGDIMVQHDTGAHSPAMGGNYNGWLRPQQLLLRTDGNVELIKRAETIDDLFATLKFKPNLLSHSKRICT
ncbi:MAG: diaminopimelate decarboxylase [Dehalococcoidales bacterium]|nr:diaminopimelate decarboxylase [Dehalococcoidales bacterium]